MSAPKYLTLIPLCLIAIALCQIPVSIPTPDPPALSHAAVSPESIARQIAVRVHVGERRSSGTIIAKRGHRYLVLTNAHVTNKGNRYRITTPDGKTYPARCARPRQEGLCVIDTTNDLALLEFRATRSYVTPICGDSRELAVGDRIYYAGFPVDRSSLKVDTGEINVQPSKPLHGGYQIGFSQDTEPGMSGGALLNTQGQLIGVLGFNSQPILNFGYQYQDGSQPLALEIQIWRKSSFAIPIATLAQIDRQDAALLPSRCQ
jgi:S1-C subfamily serine protease